jgi:hypothetical protein
VKGSCEERIWVGSFVEAECWEVVWNSCIQGEYGTTACKTIEKRFCGRKVQSSCVDKENGVVAWIGRASQLHFGR